MMRLCLPLHSNHFQFIRRSGALYISVHFKAMLLVHGEHQGRESYKHASEYLHRRFHGSRASWRNSAFFTPLERIVAAYADAAAQLVRRARCWMLAKANKSRLPSSNVWRQCVCSWCFDCCTADSLNGDDRPKWFGLAIRKNVFNSFSLDSAAATTKMRKFEEGFCVCAGKNVTWSMVQCDGDCGRCIVALQSTQRLVQVYSSLFMCTSTIFAFLHLYSCYCCTFALVIFLQLDREYSNCSLRWVSVSRRRQWFPSCPRSVDAFWARRDTLSSRRWIK